VAAITTQEESDRLGPVILADVGFPEFEHAYRFRFNPFVLLGDFYAFQANQVHYDQPQYGAVVQINHELVKGGGWSTIQTAGAPRSAYRRWLRKEDPRLPPEILGHALTHDPEGTLNIAVQLSASVDHWWAWLREGDTPLDADGIPDDEYLVADRAADVLVVSLPITNGEHQVVIRARDAEGRVDQVEDAIEVTGIPGDGDDAGAITLIPAIPYLTLGPTDGMGNRTVTANLTAHPTLQIEVSFEGTDTAAETGAAGAEQVFHDFAYGTQLVARARYTNGVDDGPWSAYSDEILVEAP
jgi:hypothetical protein